MTPLPCQPAARPIFLQCASPPVDLVRMLFIPAQPNRMADEHLHSTESHSSQQRLLAPGWALHFSPAAHFIHWNHWTRDYALAYLHHSVWRQNGVRAASIVGFVLCHQQNDIVSGCKERRNASINLRFCLRLQNHWSNRRGDDPRNGWCCLSPVSRGGTELSRAVLPQKLTFCTLHPTSLLSIYTTKPTLSTKIRPETDAEAQ